MLGLGIKLIECFKIHYASEPARGMEMLEIPFSVKNEKLKAFTRTGHTHSFYQCMYVQVASGVQLQIAEGTTKLLQDCFYLISPGIYHTFLLEEDYELEMYEIKFTIQESELSVLVEALPCVLADTNGTVQNLVEALVEEFNNATIQDAMPYIKMCELLVVLNRIAQTAVPPELPGLKPYDLEYTRFAPLFSYITQNFSEKITLEVMAELMHMEKSYFSKIFKKQFHIAPIHFLQAFRVSRGVNLMEYTEMSVAEISCAVGFVNQNSFIKAFKSLYGMSPSEYRKKIRKKMQKKYVKVL